MPKDSKVVSTRQAPAETVGRQGQRAASRPSVDVDTLPTLELEDISQESEPELTARGAAYAREYVRIEHKPTILLRNLATVIVALRIKHGDMVGSSQAYRDAVSELYSAIPTDSRARLQTAVRWHIGNVLRRHMTPRELERHGLKPTSPLERSQDARQLRAAIVKAAEAETAAGAIDAPTPRATSDHIRLAKAVTGILKNMSRDVISQEMTPDQRRTLADELAEARALVDELAKYTKSGHR